MKDQSAIMNDTKCNILIFYFSNNYGFFLLKKILQDFAFKDMIKTKSLLPKYGCHDIEDLANQIEQRKKEIDRMEEELLCGNK